MFEMYFLFQFSNNFLLKIYNPIPMNFELI